MGGGTRVRCSWPVMTVQCSRVRVRVRGGDLFPHTMHAKQDFRHDLWLGFGSRLGLGLGLGLEEVFVFDS